MKEKLLTILLSFFFLPGLGQLITYDQFTDRTKFIDNTLLTIWGANSVPTTGFQLVPKTDGFGLTYNAIKLTSDAQTNSGYTTVGSLKTLTSIDYSFPFTIDRITDTVYIEFDAIWDMLNTGGEAGRLVATLLGDYPPGGALLGEVDDISLPDPFGKPLYNIRIRNNTMASSNGPLMLYGAGTTQPPEWERNLSGPWWLPGFSVQSGGGSPGTGPNYPLSGTMKSPTSIVSTSVWKHYTWKIYPERMELWVRNSAQPATANVISLFMQIPYYLDNTYVMNQIFAAHGVSAMPPNYDWFRYANALRIYWRGGDNFSLANVNIRNRVAVTLPFAKITNFNAKTFGQDIEISANAENRNSSYTAILEHSFDGKTFKKLHEFYSSNDVNNKIHFSHLKPGTGNHFYRFSFLSPQGTKEFSEIVNARINNQITVNVFPNPSNGKIEVNTGRPHSLLKIFDNTGRIFSIREFDDHHQFNFQGSRGIYFYEVLIGGIKSASGQLIIY